MPEVPEGRKGAVWLLLQLAVFSGYFLLPVSPPLLPAGSGLWLRWTVQALGGLALVAGLALTVAGLLTLGRNLTPLDAPRRQGQLVERGVYSLARHPVYGGLVTAAVAWALVSLSLPHLLGAVVVFAVLDLKSRREEAHLLARFPAYADYRRRVKRFIPGVY